MIRIGIRTSLAIRRALELFELENALEIALNNEHSLANSSGSPDDWLPVFVCLCAIISILEWWWFVVFTNGSE